ncbi:MAG: MFS transporter, partial [Gammaproteobacteria bacterium]|nr:MFS transporter [Gammaproteobacteria bacterium]
MAGSVARRLPFYYGWVVVAIAFITMGIGVNTRTSFSLLFPQLLEDFGWTSATTAGAFSFGFFATVLYAPLMGALMDKYGPRVVIPIGVVLTATGFALTGHVTEVWHLYVTLGLLVVGGSIFFSYIGHSTFLPNWFQRRRGLAVGIAYSGVGVGSLLVLPWMQSMISTIGWQQACWVMAGVLVVLLIPINLLFQRARPSELGADYTQADSPNHDGYEERILNKDWAARDWTLGGAMRTARYWWIFFAFMSALAAWYIVQVHQTRYLLEKGFSATEAAFALGLVAFFGIAGQISIGHLSDKVSREWGWTLGALGFGLCYTTLLLLDLYPNRLVLYVMVAAQGLLGYGIAPIYSAVAADVFPGKRYGLIFGTLSVGSSIGAGAGPLIAGALYDHYGHYKAAFVVGFAAAMLSIVFIWLAAPGRIRSRVPVRPAPIATVVVTSNVTPTVDSTHTQSDFDEDIANFEKFEPNGELARE